MFEQKEPLPASLKLKTDALNNYNCKIIDYFEVL